MAVLLPVFLNSMHGTNNSCKSEMKDPILTYSSNVTIKAAGVHGAVSRQTRFKIVSSMFLDR